MGEEQFQHVVGLTQRAGDGSKDSYVRDFRGVRIDESKCDRGLSG